MVAIAAISLTQSNGQTSRAESDFERQLADLDDAIGGSQIVAEPAGDEVEVA